MKEDAEVSLVWTSMGVSREELDERSVSNGASSGRVNREGIRILFHRHRQNLHTMYPIDNRRVHFVVHADVVR